jgi:ribosomal protein S18 acetylase RimI-like enzyme
MSQPKNFNQALILAYRENPCQVLPNALWKSLSWADQFETDFKVEHDKVTQLRVWNQQHLMLYWRQDRQLRNFPLKKPLLPDFALLHQDFETAFPLKNYDNRYRSFRLFHQMEMIHAAELPAGFTFRTANPTKEAQVISDLIRSCYENLHPSPETVQGWCDHPVFAADLWVWIMDEVRGVPAALGIAEFDLTIAEGSLEWIQVLPEYRRRGLGKQLVSELLNRLQNRAGFTTVAGWVDNLTYPEMLYRNCGFQGDDIWWVLRR